MFILKNLVNPVNGCFRHISTPKGSLLTTILRFPPSGPHLPQLLHATVLTTSNSAFLLSIV